MGDLAAFARLDSAFHEQLAQLTRSTMMQQIYQIIDDAMQSAYRQNVRQQSAPGGPALVPGDPGRL